MEKTNVKLFCFVILHYNTIEDTYNAIDSIKSNYEDFLYRIIIVDNASPNNSGIVIREKYKNDSFIDTLLLKKNLGFAKANNIGYKYCVKKYNPNYIIIANSDIEFTQMDFLGKIDALYNKYHFSILGPDIYNTTDNVHQNPLREYGMKLQEIRKGIIIRKITIAANKRKGFFYATTKVYRNIKTKIAKKEITKPEDAREFNIVHIGCVLYGACFIFSRQFTKKYRIAFYPCTFMYCEEEFLWYMLKKQNDLILYSPEIKVLHRVNGSTNGSYSDVRSRIVFKETTALKSAKKLIQYIKDGCYRYDSIQ